jgi:excisionase family DNA binding protein
MQDITEWLTRKEAADLLRVSVRTLDTYIKDGRIVSHKLSPTSKGPVRVSASSIHQLLPPAKETA